MKRTASPMVYLVAMIFVESICHHESKETETLLNPQENCNQKISLGLNPKIPSAPRSIVRNNSVKLLPRQLDISSDPLEALLKPHALE